MVYRNMKNMNTNEILDSLNATPWETCLVSDNINTILSAFATKINAVLDQHIPFKEKRVKRENQPPWMNTNIKTAINERDKLLNIARKSNLQTDLEKYTHHRCKTTNLIN